MPTGSSLAIAFRALRRNRLQTSLTIVGMTIGVAAVLAMIAIGTGAEAAIEDQIRAAGMNLIVVTAGNYKVKGTDDFGGGAVEPSAALRDPDEHYLDVAQGFRGCEKNAVVQASIACEEIEPLVASGFSRTRRGPPKGARHSNFSDRLFSPAVAALKGCATRFVSFMSPT